MACRRGHAGKPDDAITPRVHAWKALEWQGLVCHWIPRALLRTIYTGCCFCHQIFGILYHNMAYGWPISPVSECNTKLHVGACATYLKSRHQVQTDALMPLLPKHVPVPHIAKQRRAKSLIERNLSTNCTRWHPECKQRQHDKSGGVYVSLLLRPVGSTPPLQPQHTASCVNCTSFPRNFRSLRNPLQRVDLTDTIPSALYQQSLRLCSREALIGQAQLLAQVRTGANIAQPTK